MAGSSPIPACNMLVSQSTELVWNAPMVPVHPNTYAPPMKIDTELTVAL